MSFLLVIPSIDIKNGKTVRVVQGIPELHSEEYGNDPVEMAKIWRAENAKIIHVVDFDAISGQPSKNIKIIEEICKSVVIPVEYAGGIRTVDDAKRMMDIGICRIVLTTVAIENPKEFEKILKELTPLNVAVALDIIDNQIIIRGRKIPTGIIPIDFAKKLKSDGVERFITTDIQRNGMLLGPNIELTKKIAEAVPAKYTHAGGVRNKDELMDLQRLMNLGVDSVIIGKALYENRFPCQKIWRIAEMGLFN
ncbi:MAG: 1-(5-phosphoribosyl)-5-[(5-phosphoribosylamino) methylideneamino]imidazole-4-carboxamide isomerase [Ignavibacterium sp.]